MFGVLNEKRKLAKKSIDFEQLALYSNSHKIQDPQSLISPPIHNKHKSQKFADRKFNSQNKLTFDGQRNESKKLKLSEKSEPSFNVFTPKMIKTTERKKQKVPGINLLDLDNLSIGSSEFFETGKDDILFEGELMKFKPGLTVNFIPRYVQISKRALRYFRNK